VPDDKFDAAGRQTVGNRHRLLGVAAIVLELHADMLAKNAAGAVKVLDSLLHTVLVLDANGSTSACDGSGPAELHIGKGGPREEAYRHDQRQHGLRFHFVPLC
jgi:hypothetical protein